MLKSDHQHSKHVTRRSAHNRLCVFSLTSDVWNYFHGVLLPKYSEQLNGVNIMSGPIFDEDYNGRVDAFKTLAP